MKGMHWTQFDHACCDLLPLVIWSRVFWPSVTWNLRKAQLHRGAKAFWSSIVVARTQYPLVITSYYLLWATKRARNPNFPADITHELHVCSQYFFGLPQRMNGMHKTQFPHFYPSYSDQACFDHLSRKTCAKHSVRAKAFGPLIVVVRTPKPLVSLVSLSFRIPRRAEM